MSIEMEDEVNVNRQLSVFKHIKKKAANDAQLLMNRIALIQKEEERARKKIEQTKERAVEILALRNDTQKRVKAYKTASGEVKQLQQIMLAKNREQEEESKRARQYRLETLQAKKKGGVIDMLMEKKYLTQMMIHEQEKEIQMKQKRRMEIKRMEEEARLKKEQERIEREQKVREYYQQKLAEEAAEAKRAERLVKELERKEKEWISKLREAQVVQEEAFDQLETALHKEGSTPPSSTLKRGPGSILRSSNGHDHGSPQSKFQGSGGSVGSGPRGGREHDWGRRNESKEGSMDGGHSRASKDRDMDGRVGDDGNGLADSMSEMNMSDPVDAVEAEESHRKSLAASNVSALTRSSAASASKREGGGLTGPRSSTSAGSGSSSKKKVIASNGKKAH